MHASPSLCVNQDETHRIERGTQIRHTFPQTFPLVNGTRSRARGSLLHTISLPRSRAASISNARTRRILSRPAPATACFQLTCATNSAGEMADARTFCPDPRRIAKTATCPIRSTRENRSSPARGTKSQNGSPIFRILNAKKIQPLIRTLSPFSFSEKARGVTFAVAIHQPVRSLTGLVYGDGKSDPLPQWRKNGDRTDRRERLLKPR